jgi:hypothetical protein
MQAKDIPEAPILRYLVDMPAKRTAARWLPVSDETPTIMAAVPAGTPEKVALAKMHALIRRGLVDGCACGCRGDFTITEQGRSVLHSLMGAK